jgi:hypothetical protein
MNKLPNKWSWPVKTPTNCEEKISI